MSIIDTKIKPFTAEAFKDGKFVTVSDAEIDSKWAVFFFYPADFTFVCPTELEDLAASIRPFNLWVLKYFLCRPTLISVIRRGMRRRMQLAK